MGVKKLLPNLSLISAGVMTGTSSIVSSSIDVSNLDNIGLFIYWTGAAVGTLSVQCSIDNINFTDFTFDPLIPQPDGASSGFAVSLNQVPFQYVRVYYTNVSSTGLLYVNLSGKDLN